MKVTCRINKRKLMIKVWSKKIFGIILLLLMPFIFCTITTHAQTINENFYNECHSPYYYPYFNLLSPFFAMNYQSNFRYSQENLNSMSQINIPFFYYLSLINDIPYNPMNYFDNYLGNDYNTQNVKYPFSFINKQEAKEKIPLTVKATILNVEDSEVKLKLESGLPTPCNSLYIESSEPDEQNHIIVQVYTTPLDRHCIQYPPPPFERIISLGNFIEGTYIVWVNGEHVGEFSF